MSKELKNKTFTSIVKRKEYDITVDVRDVGIVSRHVVVFENKTDREVDIYVELTEKYSFYYLKAETIKEDEEVDLPKAVYKAIQFEMNRTSLDLLCYKRCVAQVGVYRNGSNDKR